VAGKRPGPDQLRLTSCRLHSCRVPSPTQPPSTWVLLRCQAALDLPEEDRATYQLTLERLVCICSEEGEAAVALHSEGLLDDLMKAATSVSKVASAVLRCTTAVRSAVRGQGLFEPGGTAIDATARCCGTVVLLLGSMPGPAAAAGRAKRLHCCMQASQRLEWSLKAVHSVYAPSALAAQALTSVVGGDGGSQAVEAARLAEQLRSAMRDVQVTTSRPRIVEELSRMLAPQLRRLAELVAQAWVLTGRAAESQLARAQVAAARSCAYLSCANLAAKGRPAGGPGCGSRKCSGCRAVWYCGEACQLADWREGGHRRVCKQLAAAAPSQPT
jgi:hypothetical protein